MADNQETPDVSARDIAELLGRFDVTLADFGKRLEALSAATMRVEAQARTNGEQISKTQAVLSEVRDAVRTNPELDRDPGSAVGMLAEVLETVREAAPLLNSRAAKALRAGGTVLDYLKAGRS